MSLTHSLFLDENPFFCHVQSQDIPQLTGSFAAKLFWFFRYLTTFAHAFFCNRSQTRRNYAGNLRIIFLHQGVGACSLKHKVFLHLQALFQGLSRHKQFVSLPQNPFLAAWRYKTKIKNKQNKRRLEAQPFPCISSSINRRSNSPH